MLSFLPALPRLQGTAAPRTVPFPVLPSGAPMHSVRLAKAKLALHVRRRRRAAPEQQLHKAVASYLRVALSPPAFFTTFPSGGGGKARGGQLKAMGLLAGMPDLLVFWQDGDDSGQEWPGVLGIELKSKTGSLSKEQKAARTLLENVAAHVVVCRSIDNVQAALAFWGVPHRARLT